MRMMCTECMSTFNDGIYMYCYLGFGNCCICDKYEKLYLCQEKNGRPISSPNDVYIQKDKSEYHKQKEGR